MIQQLLQKAEAVTKMCRHLQSMNPTAPPSDENQEVDVQQLNDIDKIWKVLEELVDTETKYVVDLDSLLQVSTLFLLRAHWICLILNNFQRFLEPLHAEGYLSSPALESLLMSVRNIVNFQQAFQEELSQSFSKTMNRKFVLCDFIVG